MGCEVKRFVGDAAGRSVSMGSIESKLQSLAVAASVHGGMWGPVPFTDGRLMYVRPLPSVNEPDKPFLGR